MTEITLAPLTADEKVVPTLTVGIAFSDRENPQGDIFADADTALQRLEKKQQRGYSIY